ncbi:Ig-like domain-containing protein [Streptomyces sp. NPDC058572]|uniref:L,D-transpeptidase n=1 Tax=Streptomyces sp. NPDC058572 TaxID=3346546 RepID=UPI003657AA75
MEKRVVTDSKWRRGFWASFAMLGGVLVLLTACSVAAASEARIAITPKNGATNAGLNRDTKVTMSGGRLTRVTMATEAGAEVAGTLAANGLSWKPDAPLRRSTTYRISAAAADAKGREAHENTMFSTVSRDSTFMGNFTPEDGSTVGVGMPVSITFDKGITDKKAVQSAINVTSSSGQEIVGHWFGASRLDFRPQQYWKAGSTVTLKLALEGVEGASGITGVQDKTVTFRVGRNQVSIVDTEAKTMTVTRDGKTVKTIPVSAGSPETPTYNGRMVISEKFKETRMDGATVGFTKADGKGEYDIKDVPHAMRLSTSGTFIHGNYWGDDSIFGSVNTSHGCIGLNDVKGAGDPKQPAAWLYDNSLLGDVVEVRNSPDRTIKPDNGLNGWNMPWEQWKAGSAL